MENDIYRIKQSLRKLENKLQMEELFGEEIIKQIEKYRGMSMKISEQIQNITWKKSKANFIQTYEKARYYSYLDKIGQSAIHKQKSNDSESSKRSLEERIELRNSLSNKLELLIERNNEKKNLIFHSKQVLNSFKEENIALMGKLLTALQDSENEEKKLEDILEDIQAEEENFVFYYN